MVKPRTFPVISVHQMRLPLESVPARTKSMRDRIDLVFVIDQAFVSAVHALSLRLSGPDAVSQCSENDRDKNTSDTMKAIC